MKQGVSPIEDVFSTLTTESLKLAYRHLGGVISKIPNGQKETYISVLCNKPEITSIERWMEVKEHDASVDKDDAVSDDITQDAMVWQPSRGTASTACASTCSSVAVLMDYDLM